MQKIEMDIHSEKEMEMLHKAQECNRKLLRELDRVCKKYGLKYYLICGTLLGAVRHKSFVPWDDDADIAMTREDFNKLKKISKIEWNGNEFLFLDYSDMKSGAFLDYMSRLMYMKEEVPVITFDKIRGKGRNDVDNHIPLDIYVLDNASDDDKKHNIQTKILQGIYGLGMGHRAFVDYSEYADQPERMQKLIKRLIKIGRLLPARLIFAAYEVVRKWYNRKETANYIMSNGFIFCLPWKFPKVWFGEGSQVKIDGEEFSAPSMWREYLGRQYGDYMLLPPLEYRHPTHTFGASPIHHTVDYTKGTERMTEE